MVYTSDLIQIMLALAVGIYYLCIFFIWGSVLTRFCKIQLEKCFSHALIIGYLAYYLLFECVALPMKIYGCSVTRLSQVWLGIIVVLTLAAILLNGQYIGRLFAVWRKEFPVKRKYIGIFGGLTLLIFLIIITVTPVTMGVQDDSYYIANVMTSLVTDSIQQYDYATGALLSGYDLAYFIPMYPIHGAVICRLTSLHPMVENKWCSVFLVLLISNLIYRELSLRVCRGDERKSLQLFALMMFFRFNYVLWGKAASTFFFFRISEGKGILANLILPALILFFWEAMEKEIRFGWLTVELVILGAFSISMSSMFLVSVSLGCLMLAGLAGKKDLRLLIPYTACALPCVGLVVVYEMMIRGIITIPIL